MRKIILLFTVLITMAGSSISQVSSGSKGNHPETIFVKNQINTNRVPSGCNFLIFMDNLPWGSSAIQDILTANGETFTVLNSSLMSTTDFELYDVIIIASDQVPAFYANFAASFPAFVSFVTNGGSLEVHAATCGWNSPCGYSVVLPGGVYTTEQYDNYNNVVDAGHPIVAGVSNPFYGNYASHGYFSNLVTGTDIITETTSNNMPSTIQYTYGTGVVTATTCTYEFGYIYGQEAGEMLVNDLYYSCEHHNEPVPLSDWAIGLGIFLILGAALIRYKRLF
jgi:hypothetical protein